MANTQVVGGGSVTAAKANDITVGDTAPTSPSDGWVWIDNTGTSTPIIKVWNATAAAWQVGGIAPSIFTNAGDLLYATGSAAYARLGIGTANQILRTNAGATAPEWYTPTDATIPGTSTIGGAGSAGSSLLFARRDHAHPITSPVLTANSTGTSISIATSGISGFVSMCRVVVYIGSGAGSIGMRFNNVSTGAPYSYNSNKLNNGGVTNNAGLGTNSVTIYADTGGDVLFDFLVYAKASGTGIYMTGQWSSLQGAGLLSALAAGMAVPLTSVDFFWTGSAAFDWKATAY